jgi:AcrR family transcriptional regulator
MMASLTHEDDPTGRRQKQGGGGETIGNDALPVVHPPPPPPVVDVVATIDPPSRFSPNNIATTSSFVPPFGVSESTLLEPVCLPPKKVRRIPRDEFTISQKLSILSELGGANAMRVHDLAARHNTSRASIYRWRNDMARLMRLATRRGGGDGSRKRVTGVGDGDDGDSGGNAQYGPSSSSSKGSGSAARKLNDANYNPRGRKKRRKNEEYTAAEKLAIVRELAVDASTSSSVAATGASVSSRLPPTVRALADRVGANHRSVYRWKKDEARLTKLVEEEGRGTCKRDLNDPMSRLKDALRAFHAVQYGDIDDPSRRAPHHVGQRTPPPSLTGTIVATKALQIRDDLLARHGEDPFLSDAEVRALADFTGSASWGRKIVQKFGWRGGTGTVAANGTADGPDGNADYDNDDAGGKIPKPRQSSSVARKNETKREVASLRRRLHCAEARARELEAENAALKSRLAMLTTSIDGGADGGVGCDLSLNDTNDSMNGDDGGGGGSLDGATRMRDAAVDSFENLAVEE